jgi:hypothetical protein
MVRVWKAEMLKPKARLKGDVRLFLTVIVLTLAFPFASRAITILSGPSFSQATNAPLAGTLSLTTDVSSRVSVSVDDGVQPWTRNFYDFTTNHAVTLAGFKPGRTNLITVTVYDQHRNQAVAPQPLVFITSPLPTNFPVLTLLQSVPDQMEPGYTLFGVVANLSRIAYHVIVDSSGEVVWYSSIPALLEIRQLTNGDFFLFGSASFMEIDLLGQTVKTWTVPSNLPIDIHEGVPTAHDTILYLTDSSTVVSNYPTSTTVSNAPVATANNVLYQNVVEISADDASVLNTWSPINDLDPRRITYLTTIGPPSWDSEHCNAVTEDPSDNSLIISMRDQNAVIKISRATGQLIWILGPPDNWGPQWQPYLLTPVGLPFGWQYGQHSPVITPRGTLMLYDDGNFRASPFALPVADANNYSRAVEYAIDQTNMTVSQVWDYGRDDALQFYTDKVGSAYPLPQTGNILVTFGSVRYVNGAPPSSYGVNATMARIQEVTYDAAPTVLFDLAVTEYNNTNVVFRDCSVYRSHRIPDLYGHLPQPVADLTLEYQNGISHLQFSADTTRTYIVQASSDLQNWQSLGIAEEAEDGTFEFDDPSTSLTRYYRILSQ